MAVGDIVNIALNSATSYQPAAGIEILILKTFNGTTVAYIGITDGAITANNYLDYNAAGPNEIGNKMGITNSLYYSTVAALATSGFTGIQLK